MAAQTVACPSCQTTLALPSNIGPDAKIKCPKCGTVLGIPRKKILTPVDSQPALAAEVRPALARPLPTTPILAYALPVCAILLALVSLALPVLIGQYILGLIIACLAALGSVIGLVLLFLKRWTGTPIHLAGAAICATAILVCVNAILLQGSIERNAELLAKNEQAAAKAKADLDESKKKLAEAEDAPRKAEAILKKAEEAPKKAEAFYELAKTVQAKADAAEKRNAELLAKAEDLEKKNDLDRKKIADDRAKVELSEKNLKALQKTVDQTQKEIDEKRQDLVTLKKEIEADKKAAADEMAALKKEIDADRKKAEEKQKEAKDLLRKIEGTLKAAALKLQDKNPAVRLATAKQLAKLPAFPEAKDFVGEAVCLAMLDPVPAVGIAAAEALEKIDPAVHPHAVTLIIGQEKGGGARELGKLGKNAKSALPILFYYHYQTGKTGAISTDYLFDILTMVAPDDERVVRLVLDGIAKTQPIMGNGPRFYALNVLDRIDAKKKDKLKALTMALNDGVDAIRVIEAIAAMGSDAADAVPILTRLKLSTDDQMRDAATKALAKIQKK